LFWVGREQLAACCCREKEKYFSVDKYSLCFHVVGYFFNSGMVIALFKVTTGKPHNFNVNISIKEKTSWN